MIVISSSISAIARASIFVACCAAAAATGAPAADAQSRLPVPFLNSPAPQAPVQSSGFYQETKLAQSPTQCNHEYCGLGFSKIPAGKVLVITNVNCFFSNDKGGPVFAGLNDNDSTVAGLGFCSLGFFSTSAHAYFYASNEPVLLLILAGHIPDILVIMSTPQDTVRGQCTISGELK